MAEEITTTHTITADEEQKIIDDNKIIDNNNNDSTIATSASASASAATTPWSTYLNALNAKYQDKIRKMAQNPNYMLHFRYDNGKEEKQLFTRMKLLQWQFDEIEDLRAQAGELQTTNARESQKVLSIMYKKASGYILYNPTEKRPMTEDEYSHCIFSEVRPALDASMLLSLISDPN